MRLSLNEIKNCVLVFSLEWEGSGKFAIHTTRKREIVRVKKEETGKIEEVWTGDFVFENEWQSLRTKKSRTLELKTPFHECAKGRYKIAVKVVDIFGNDTMKIVEVGCEH